MSQSTNLFMFPVKSFIFSYVWISQKLRGGPRVGKWHTWNWLSLQIFYSLCSKQLIFESLLLVLIFKSIWNLQWLYLKIEKLSTVYPRLQKIWYYMYQLVTSSVKLVISTQFLVTYAWLQVVRGSIIKGDHMQIPFKLAANLWKAPTSEIS